MNLASALVAGAAGGAAGTTALNVVTYLDMAVRGRSTSSAPEDSMEALVSRAGLRIPGEEDTRKNRLAGLGAMAATDGSMAALGVSDLRTWTRMEWLSDAVPHLAYGLATAAVAQALDPD